MDQELVAGRHATLSENPIRSGADYIESLRGRNLKVYLMGELVAEPVDHPIIRPSINAVAETYDLANSNPELASATSPLTADGPRAELSTPTLRRVSASLMPEPLRAERCAGTCSPPSARLLARSASHPRSSHRQRPAT